MIVYRPHVGEADGAVLTPDLILSSLAVRLPGRPPLPVPIARLAFGDRLQEYAGRIVTFAGFALIAASRGPLIAPAAIHADRAALADDPQLALRACSQMLAREAWRLASPDAWSLETAGDPVPLAPLIAELPQPAAEQVVLVAIDAPPTPHPVAIRGPLGRLVLRYAIEEIGA